MIQPLATLPDLLTRREAAEFLRITLPTLHRWTRTGLLKAYRLGGRVYYRIDDIKTALRPNRS